MPKSYPVWAERIKQLRLDQKQSQAVLADRAGLGLVTIRAIEEGANTTTDSLQAVAAALGVTLEALLCAPVDLPKLTEFQLDLLVKQHMAALARHQDEQYALLRLVIDESNDAIVKQQAQHRQTRLTAGLPPDPNFHTTRTPPSHDEKETAERDRLADALHAHDQHQITEERRERHERHERHERTERPKRLKRRE